MHSFKRRQGIDFSQTKEEFNEAAFGFAFR